MRELLVFVKSAYDDYNGTGMQMALFFSAILYLIVEKKEKEADKRYLFLGYTLLLFFILFFPVTAKIITRYCIGEGVYWRMFWLLPTSVIISYVAVQVLMRVEKKTGRYLLLAFMAAMISMTGTIVYNGSIFQPKQNNYKISQDAVDICDIIEADAAARGIEEKKLIVSNELLEYIRQYDGDIKMPYGYNAVKGLKIKGAIAAKIYGIMCNENKNWEALNFYAALEDCNYLACPIDENTANAVSGWGYERVGGNAAYDVYRQTRDKSSLDGQWLVSQYGPADGSQLMFYTLTDTKGHVIVIDGGWRDDADFVKKELKKLGNHVDAWFVTHPHRDHAGAFYEIYKKPGKLKIDRVYMVDMAPVDLCLSNAPWDEVEVYEKILELEIPQLTYVHAGDELEVAGLDFEIFNAYDDYVDELSDDLLNDGSMLFKVTGKTQSMLFCSDVGKSMSDYLLEKYGDRLKADYLQMGHHGNGGLKKDFYESIGAKAAFFDSPRWLMEDTSGRYQTMKNITIMAEQGAGIYSFATSPNQFVLK